MEQHALGAWLGTLLILLLVACGGGGTDPTGEGAPEDPPATSGNANLAGLTCTEGTLTPAFAPEVENYTLVVGFLVDSVRVTATSEDPDATLSVNGLPAMSGAESAPLLVTPAPTPVSIEVIAADETTTRRYTVVTSRAPLVHTAYIKAGVVESQDEFGSAIAASEATLVVGAPHEDSGVAGDPLDNSASSVGAVYVFTRDGGEWSQQAILKASNGDALDFFGSAVALSGDTIVVGAIGEDGSGAGDDDALPDSGAAYVFVRTGTTWTQQAYLKASNADAYDAFGASVAISGDVLVVGAPREDSATTVVSGQQDDDSAESSGAVYAFVRSDGTWTQEAYLKASNVGAFDWFGTVVSLSEDTVVVGAFGEDSAATGVDGDGSDDDAQGAGAAYVFVRAGTLWRPQAYLKAPESDPFDRFGFSVSIDGETIAVGAEFDGGPGNATEHSGAVCVFTRAGDAWSQQACLNASNAGVGDHFGYAVAVLGDNLVVGARGERSNSVGVDGDETNDDAPGSGAAYLFTRTGTSWEQRAFVKATNTESGDRFGTAVALSSDSVFVATPSEDGGDPGIDGEEFDNSAVSSGAAYVLTSFTRPRVR